jgi:hypothetical protein
MQKQRNLGLLMKNKKGGFLGQMLGLLAPVLGKVLGKIIPGNGLKGFGNGLPKKTKKTKKGDGVFSMIKKLATSPLAKKAMGSAKKKIIDMALKKGVSMLESKLQSGNGLKKVRKTTKNRVMNNKLLGTPSYNKGAVVTVSKVAKTKTNAIKPARKIDFFR